MSAGGGAEREDGAAGGEWATAETRRRAGGDESTVVRDGDLVAQDAAGHLRAGLPQRAAGARGDRRHPGAGPSRADRRAETGQHRTTELNILSRVNTSN